jgi:hypothetical protein
MPEHVRIIWLFLIMFMGLFVAGVAGVLAYLGGATPPNATAAAGGAFAGTVALLFAVAHFLRGNPS